MRVKQCGSLRAIIPRPHHAETLFCVTLAAASLMLFFRDDLFSGFASVLGDRLDGTIELALLQHWSNVVDGVEAWNRPDFFFPAQDTLGYNDGYLLTGLTFAVLRALGAGIYIASEATNALVKLSGFVGFVLFATKVFRCRLWVASLGGVVFTDALNSYVQSGHAQLFTVSFAPILGTIVVSMVQAITAQRRRAVLAYGAVGAVFFAAWLLTAFYAAWFFALYTMLAATITLFAFAGRVAEFGSAARRCARPICLAAIILAASLMPFLVVYVPKASETGMHRFREVFGYLSTPIDILDVGTSSPFFRALQFRLAPLFSPGSEHIMGLTPVLLIVFAVALAGLASRSKNANARFASCMGLSAILFWCASIRFGHFTAWRLIYDTVPGARGVRVISRVPLLLEWPVVTVVTVGLNEIGSSALRRGWRLGGSAVTAIVLLALIVEQIRPAGQLMVNRARETTWLRSIPRPPADCSSFFVARNRDADVIFGQRLSELIGHGISAMLVAEWLRLPTINGFATFVPAGWNLMGIDQPDYLARVQTYARDHRLAGLCGLDLQAARWSELPVARPVASGRTN